MKSKYHADFPLMAEGYARDGLNDVQIAQKLGISTSTFYDYQQKHPEFSEALARGKAPVDVQVENALFKRCVGCVVKEEVVDIDASGKKRVRTTTKEIPPDVGACTHWLAKRKPQKWGGVAEEVATTNNEDVAQNIEGLTFEEQQKIIEGMLHND